MPVGGSCFHAGGLAEGEPWRSSKAFETCVERLQRHQQRPLTVSGVARSIARHGRAVLLSGSFVASLLCAFYLALDMCQAVCPVKCQVIKEHAAEVLLLCGGLPQLATRGWLSPVFRHWSSAPNGFALRHQQCGPFGSQGGLAQKQRHCKDICSRSGCQRVPCLSSSKPLQRSTTWTKASLKDRCRILKRLGAQEGQSKWRHAGRMQGKPRRHCTLAAYSSY